MALDDGRSLHAAPPVPLFDVASRLGLRRVSYDRPGYGGCSPHPARDVASAAADAAAVADVLGIGRFAAFGHSGGAPHAPPSSGCGDGRVRGAPGAPPDWRGRAGP